MFRGTINKNGRPKGIANKVTTEVKELIQQLAADLYQSIDINELRPTDKAKLFIGLLPYITPKQAQIEANINPNLTWLDDFTESELESLLKAK